MAAQIIKWDKNNSTLVSLCLCDVPVDPWRTTSREIGCGWSSDKLQRPRTAGREPKADKETVAAALRRPPSLGAAPRRPPSQQSSRLSVCSKDGSVNKNKKIKDRGRPAAGGGMSVSVPPDSANAFLNQEMQRLAVRQSWKNNAEIKSASRARTHRALNLKVGTVGPGGGQGRAGFGSAGNEGATRPKEGGASRDKLVEALEAREFQRRYGQSLSVIAGVRPAWDEFSMHYS